MKKYIYLSLLSLSAITFATSAATIQNRLPEDKERTGVKLINENFEYEAGNLVGNGEWLDYKYNNLGGDPAIQVVDNALEYADYTDVAKGLAIELQGKGGDAAIPFQSTTETLYASMLVNVKDANDSKNTFMAFGTGDTPNRNAHFGQIILTRFDDKFSFGIAQKSLIYDENGVKYTEGYDFGETMLIVIKYNQGRESNDDYIEMFVNPTSFFGEEPQATIRTDEVLNEPTSGLTFLKLVQNGIDVSDYNLIIDDIRLATSWEALFDGSAVELAPEITTSEAGTFNLGEFEQGGEPIMKTINIKAKNLRSDLTVSTETEGYISIKPGMPRAAIIVPKEAAESGVGFDLVIKLDPKDANVLNDVITLKGELVNYSIPVEWTYKFDDSKRTGVKLINENFEYEAGNLAGNGEWLDYKYNNLGGDPAIQVVDNALEYADYTDVAKGLAVELQGKGGDAAIPFQSTTGTLYASMLVNVKNANDSKNTFVAFGTGDTPDRNAHFGQIILTRFDDKFSFGIAQKPLIYEENGVKYTEEYDFGQTMLLVIKYTQNPKSDDDYIELFVNPTDFSAAEPQATIRTDEVLTEPSSGLTFLELVQNGTDVSDYNLIIDDIRLATSWEALFDGSAVELAPEITVSEGRTLNLGEFEQDGEPLVKTINIKAKNLRSDLTVSAGTEGYITFNTATITKDAAESEQGFDLIITVDPKDDQVLNDLITVEGVMVKNSILVEWNYKTSGVDDILQDETAVYSNGRFVAKNAMSISVYDLTGKCLLKTEGTTIDMTELSHAVYLVRYQDVTGLVHNLKVAK